MSGRRARSGKLFSVTGLICEQPPNYRAVPAALAAARSARPPPPCPHGSSGPGASAAPSGRRGLPGHPLPRCAAAGASRPSLAHRGAANRPSPGPPHLQVTVQAQPCFRCLLS